MRCGPGSVTPWVPQTSVVAERERPAAEGILFQPRGEKAVKEWLPVIAALSDRGYQPAVLLDWPCAPAWLAEMRQAGATLAHVHDPREMGNIEAHEPGVSRGGPGSRHVTSRPRLATVVRRMPGVGVLSSLRVYWRVARSLEQVLDRFRPRLVVVPSDRNLERVVLLRLAERRGIPSLMLPQFFDDPPVVRAEQRLDAAWPVDLSLRPLANRVAAAVFPRLVYRQIASPVVAYPGEAVLALALLGITPPPQPWQRGSVGLATRIAVESSRMRQVLLEDGLPSERIAVTGKPRTDLLFYELQNDQRELRTRMGIPWERAVILFAVDDLYERGRLSMEQHWREIEFVVASAARVPGAIVVLSLYPQMRREDYVPLAERYGAVLPENSDIFRLMPICDVFLVSVGSSTVALALGVRKRVVTINYWGHQPDPHVLASGNRTIDVGAQADLLPTLRDAVASRDSEVGEVGRTDTDTGEVPPIDGRCTERVLAEILSLARGR